MSPEMREMLIQMHEEWMQDTTILYSRPLETMKWAYEQTCAGKDPWTGLGCFSHSWYGYAKSRRAELVSEPIARPEQETEYTHRWGAFCAASVEFLCERYNVPCPDWVHDSYYILDAPWWRIILVDSPLVREHLLKDTPEPFARRNVFCGNRIFQNKYEMFEWTQEARATGITDPGKIWNYARDKEISVHGA